MRFSLRGVSRIIHGCMGAEGGIRWRRKLLTGWALAAVCGFASPASAVIVLGGYPVSYTHLTLPTNREV